jgi:anti-anti-sigma regulatory factor
MIRITAHQEPLATRLCLEGKLSGGSVDVLDECWQAASSQTNSIWVDLTAVSFIDTRGKELLARMFEKGTRLISRSLMGRCLIEEINTHNHISK